MEGTVSKRQGKRQQWPRLRVRPGSWVPKQGGSNEPCRQRSYDGGYCGAAREVVRQHGKQQAPGECAIGKNLRRGGLSYIPGRRRARKSRGRAEKHRGAATKEIRLSGRRERKGERVNVGEGKG